MSINIDPIRKDVDMLDSNYALMGPHGGTMNQKRDPETIEEELELFAEALRLRIDPFSKTIRRKIIRLHWVGL